MRTIKFRAWNRNYKKMFYSEVEQNLDLLPIWIRNPEVYDLMQSTGLFDSKGNEIWEGDVIEGSTKVYEKGGYRSKEREKAMVEISPEGVRFNRRPYNKYSKYEIIGNIYENPDLLTTK